MTAKTQSIFHATFVFGEDEVKLTGRCATKALPGGKTLTLVEVTPCDDSNGTWKKFVQRQALLEIREFKGDV